VSGRRTIVPTGLVVSGLVAGPIVVVAGSLGPWLRSGRQPRSSYQLAALLDRLDLLSGPSLLVVRVWVLVPLAAGAVIATALLGRVRLAGAIGTFVGLFAAAVAAMAVLAAHRSPLRTQWGVVTTTLGALPCTFAGVIALTRSSGRGRRPGGRLTP
jgi:hypothetical protein